jgi:cytochrome b involved in lipid metabolism
MAVKKFLYSVFIAFWSSIATILILAALAGEKEKPAAKAGKVISKRELASHNTAADCWMAIEGKVYKLTSYIPKHPTPANVITQWCGKEATKAFNTKGYGRPHSPAAEAMLLSYLVGTLSGN